LTAAVHDVSQPTDIRTNAAAVDAVMLSKQFRHVPLQAQPKHHAETSLLTYFFEECSDDSDEIAQGEIVVSYKSFNLRDSIMANKSKKMMGGDVKIRGLAAQW
jgi:hypothetical protein